MIQRWMYFHLIYLNELEIIANCYQLTDNQSSIPTYVKKQPLLDRG